MYILKWKKISNPDIEGTLSIYYADYATAVIASQAATKINSDYEYYIEEVPNNYGGNIGIVNNDNRNQTFNFWLNINDFTR